MIFKLKLQVALKAAFLTVMLSVTPYVTASDQDDAQQRLAFIKAAFEKQQTHANVWQWGWTGVYAASLTLNASDWVDAGNSDDRWNYGVGTVRSALAIYQQWSSPLPSYQANKLAAMAQNSQSDTDATLVYAEQLLQQYASRDAARFTWKPHMDNLIANLIAGGVIAAFGDKNDAWLAFGTGVLSGELALWTEPYGGNDLWQQYQQKFAGVSGKTSRFSVLPSVNQLAVRWEF